MNKGKNHFRRPYFLIAIIFIIFGGCAKDNGSKTPFDKKADALKKEIVKFQTSFKIKYNSKESGYIVFLSVCNKDERAVVFHAGGKTPKAAFNNAAEKARNFINEKEYQAYWVKADIVNTIRAVDTAALEELLKASRSKGFRYGIAYDKLFECAFLETEINSNNLLSYTDKAINVNNTRSYLRTRGERNLFTEIPPEFYLFTTIGFFCDENNKIYELYSNYSDYGRRKVALVDDKLISHHIAGTVDFLKRQAREDGRFVYGYYPIFDREIGTYNIIRHAATVWCLIEQYALTGDVSLVPYIEDSLKYLEENIENAKDDIAYVIERNVNEVKLGANALAILTLVSYMENFQTRRYEQLVVQLANGILSLMDEEEGSYWHVLNYPDYSPKEKYRIVYYDGEATFALARAYSFTLQEKYLEAAKKAVEYFIKHNYEKHQDHWVAYSVNEVTKYYPDERFLEFGLLNVQVNLETIYGRDTLYHTYLEVLMATFEIYDRIMENHPNLEYLSTFDDKYFFETIFHRAEYMLNYFIYPEVAMYFQNPGRILDAFFVRHVNYRMRIDDQAHVICGYQKYVKHYKKLEKYGKKWGIRR